MQGQSQPLPEEQLAYWLEGEVACVVRQEGLPAYTEYTITDPVRLRQELVRVREQGYAIYNQERELGVRCIASPLVDGSGRVVAAISLSGPAGRISAGRDAELGAQVRPTALTISQHLA